MNIGEHDRISGKIEVVRRSDNQRLMNVGFKYKFHFEGQKDAVAQAPIKFQIE